MGRNITKGLGAGGYVEVGEKVMEKDRDFIDIAIPHGSCYFVVFSLGGGTGTAAYKVMELLKKRGKKIIGITNLPFKLERRRKKKAKYGFEKAKENSDLLIFIETERITEIVKGLHMQEAFTVADEIFARLMKAMINDYEKIKDLKGIYSVAVFKEGEKKDLEERKLCYGEFKPVVEFKGREVFIIGEVEFVSKR